MAQPEISVVIINWNGRHFLGKCIYSLLRQSYKGFEIIVVDGASADGSVEYLNKRFPQVKIIKNLEDPGPIRSNKQGFAAGSGKYILIMNNDVVLPKNTLFKMVEKLKDNERDVVTPLQFDWNRKFISAGIPAPWVAKALAKVVKLKGNRPFYPSQACCLVARKTLDEVPLNEHLLFFEDTEWGWRLLLAGRKTVVVDNAFFYHKWSGTVKETPKEAFFCGRIPLATYFICLSLPTFFLFLPILIAEYYFPRFIRFSRKPKLLANFIRGAIDFFKFLGSFNQDRIQVQKTRTIGDCEIIKLMIQSVDYDKTMRIKHAKDLIS